MVCLFEHQNNIVGSEEIMNKIDDKKHNELIIILSELIETIELMKEEKDYLLI